MKATQEKLTQALLLLKSAADDIEKSNSKLGLAYDEVAIAFACAGRAKRLLLSAESDGVAA
jgi:hypothetical protein